VLHPSEAKRLLRLAYGGRPPYLEVYTRPHDERFAQVCLDEKSKQLVGEVREALGAEPGKGARQRAPAKGRPPRLRVRAQRDGQPLHRLRAPPRPPRLAPPKRHRAEDQDRLGALREGVGRCPLPPSREDRGGDGQAEHPHSGRPLRGVRPGRSPRRIYEKLEIHYTPKHGSWLNMAEIELSVLARQCLGDRRIPDRESLAEEAGAWEVERNAAESSIDWRFTAADARIKLKRLYPETVEGSSYDPNPS
jgi:hypothetical protein